MTIAPKDKLRILHVAKMLIEQTDEDQGLSMTDIITQLGEVGISAERKSIYRDLEALNQVGLSITRLQRSPVQYAITKRTFSLSELSLLIDAVQSSRFLTKSKARELTNKVKTLASAGQQNRLRKEMYVEGRIRSTEESTLHNVSTLQAAILEKVKITFQYWDYGLRGKKITRKGGKYYCENPVRLIYSEGNYYLISYNDKHENFVTYRVDRMRNIVISEEPITRKEEIATFNPNLYTNRAFSMYSGDQVSVKLRASKSAINAIVDRFGTDIPMTACGDSDVIVSVRVMESPSFYGWVAQFGSAVKIEAPASLVEGYVEHLKTILASYPH